MEFSVNALVRNQLVNWFGPQKPALPTPPLQIAQNADNIARDAFQVANANYMIASQSAQLEQSKYLKKVEVFVYNATVGIANGALLSSVVAVAAFSFSFIGPVFALFAIVGSVAIHLDAKRTLPTIGDRTWMNNENNQALIVPNNEIDTSNRNQYVRTSSTLPSPITGSEEVEQVKQKFGLPQFLFKGRENIWEQSLLTVGGVPLLFNFLPEALEPLALVEPSTQSYAEEDFGEHKYN